MFDFKLMNKAIGDKTLTPAAGILLYYVVNAIGATDNGEKILSDANIEKRTMLSLSTIKRARQLLRERGYINVTPLKNKYGTTSLSYSLCKEEREERMEVPIIESTVEFNKVKDNESHTVNSFLSDF